MRSFLKENDLLSDDKNTIFERFLDYFRRFAKLSGGIGPTELSIEMHRDDNIESLFKMTELLELLPDIRATLKHEPLCIYIDELDQSWDNSKISNNFLISLFTAALQLHGVDKNLQIFIFLRSRYLNF